MIEIKNKQDCCGCSACEQICPVKAIEMKIDNEGFYYPEVNESVCVYCGKCKKICPVLNKGTENSNYKKVLICQNKSLETRLDSTSGGVFSALANFVLEKDGVVFGAVLDEHFVVKHEGVTSAESLHRIRGSKYVQSRINDTYQQVKNYLNEDKYVLFTGTPCQVAALRSYLGKEYEKLLLMDIVCYSISSPGIWKQYLEHIEKCGKVKTNQVYEIRFRDKSKYGYEYTLMTFYDEKKRVLYASGPESNQMLRSFVSNTSTRPSCYDCKFKGTSRQSDFTAWDCYNIYKYDKALDDNKGSSHIMVNSDKGMKLLEELSAYLNYYEVDAQRAIESEPAMTECAVPGEMRSAFFDDYSKGTDVFDIYFQDTIRVKIERLLRHGLSKIGLYRAFKRIMKG